jgi:hypothetical protein
VEKHEEDKNQITTTKYFNIFDGDAYRFRPRGFLYIVGRKQYYQIYEDFNKGGEVAIQSPYELSNTVEGAIQASIAQDLLFTLPSPWTFANLVFFIYKFLATLFMSYMK